MAVQPNHTIVAARDAETPARWFAEMFGVDDPERLGHFWQISTANGVGLDGLRIDERCDRFSALRVLGE